MFLYIEVGEKIKKKVVTVSHVNTVKGAAI